MKKKKKKKKKKFEFFFFLEQTLNIYFLNKIYIYEILYINIKKKLRFFKFRGQKSLELFPFIE